MTDISHLSTEARPLPGTYGAFVTALKKPGEAILATLTAQQADLTHMAIGLAGECAELLEPFLNHQEGDRGRLIDRNNVVEELGDIEFFMQGIHSNIGLPRCIESAVGHAREGRTVTLLRMVIASGNILDIVKRNSIYGKTLDVERLNGALETFEILLSEIYAVLGVTREEVINHNVQKLATRYASLSYSDAQAQARADKA